LLPPPKVKRKKLDVPPKRPAPSTLHGVLTYDQRINLPDEVIRQIAQSSLSVGDDKSLDILTVALEQSCVTFAQEILTGPPEAPYNGRFIVGKHHIAWDKLLRESRRICVLAPRDHGKSRFFDFAYPIWKAVNIPNGVGYIFSATKDQAVRILGDIKEEIENNPKLAHLIPDTTLGMKQRKWSSTAIQLRNGHKIYARGFGTKVRGAHPHWIVVDDGLNDETSYSEVVRKKQIDYFFTAISNMVVPGGQIIVVGTPFHQSDLYGVLAKNPEYLFRRYQALNGKDETPLWEARYSREALLQKRREVGVVRFTREFQCNPVSDDTSLFPEVLFQGEPTEQFHLTLGLPYSFWERAGITPYMGVDFAMSATAGADYMVIWVIGLDSHGNRWLIDLFRAKGLAYQRQLSVINRLGRKYKPALIFLEANQMQRIFGDELIRTTDLPIKKFVTTAVKHLLDKGVPSLRVLLENGKFRIPRGDAKSVEATDIWIDEMRSMTFDKGEVKSVGEHDDTVLALWICDQAIRQGGFSFGFGDEDATGESIDEMLAKQTAEKKPVAHPDDEPETELDKATEERIRAALGITEEEKPGASGNLMGDDEGDPFSITGALSPDMMPRSW